MRKLIAILLCLAMVIPFAACGSSSPAASPETGSGSGSDAAVSTGSSEPVKTDSTETAPAENESGSEPAADTSSFAGSSEINELETKYYVITQDSLTWTYDSSTRTISVSGEGPMRSYLGEEPEWYIYCDEAENVIIGDGVTSVSAGAFLWFQELRNVQLGQSVEFIGDSAFGNTSVWTVNFPAGLKYIGNYAFNNAILHSDTGFHLPEGLLYIGDAGFYSAFKEGTVYIPASVEHIGRCAFANTYVEGFDVDPGNPAYASADGVFYDRNMTTLFNYPATKTDRQFDVPGTVNTIATEAFEVTNTLERITIPASVTSIEEAAIYWNYALASIDVDPANSCYKSVDGVLFTKDGKQLIAYPIAADRTEYTVPAGTERICRFSLSQANSMNTLYADDGLLEIGEFALYYTQNLTSVSLPESIRSIEEKAFSACDALSVINYAGSSAGWQNVSVGEDDGTLSGGSVVINCAQ